MSNEKKYTPGPWRLGRTGKRGYRFIDGPGWHDLARVVVKVDGIQDPSGEANARLIAAAPLMYERLVKEIGQSETDKLLGY